MSLKRQRDGGEVMETGEQGQIITIEVVGAVLGMVGDVRPEEKVKVDPSQIMFVLLVERSRM